MNGGLYDWFDSYRSGYDNPTASELETGGYFDLFRDFSAGFVTPTCRTCTVPEDDRTCTVKACG